MIVHDELELDIKDELDEYEDDDAHEDDDEDESAEMNSFDDEYDE